MKLAQFSILVALLYTCTIACKNQPENNSDSAPLKETEIQPVDNSSDKKELPGTIHPIPKEQKSDRRIHRKKNKNALDTLRPKTA